MVSRALVVSVALTLDHAMELVARPDICLLMEDLRPSRNVEVAQNHPLRQTYIVAIRQRPQQELKQFSCDANHHKHRKVPAALEEPKHL